MLKGSKGVTNQNYHTLYKDGNFYLRQQKTKQALTCFNDAIIIAEKLRAQLSDNKSQNFNSNLSAIYAKRAAIHCDNKNYDAAISDYTNAIQLNPNNPKLLFKVCKIHYQQKQYRDVLKLLDKILKINPNYQTAINLRRKIIRHITTTYDQTNLMEGINLYFEKHQIYLPEGYTDIIFADTKQEVIDKIDELQEQQNIDDVYLLVHLKNQNNNQRTWHLCYLNSQSELITQPLKQITELAPCIRSLPTDNIANLDTLTAIKIKQQLNNYIKSKYFAIQNGHCSGFTTIQIDQWLFNPYADPKKHHPVIENILNNSVDGNFTHKDFLRAISALRFAQNPDEYLPHLSQDDVPAILKIIDPRNANDQIKLEYTCDLILHHDLFAKIFKSKLIPNNRAFSFGANDHNIAMLKRNDKFYVYDPNHPDGIEEFRLNELNKLCDFLQESLFIIDINDCAQIKMFVFTADQLITNYQKSMTNKVQNFLQKETLNPNKLKPKDSKAYFNFGNICFKNQMYCHAIKYYEKAKELDPQNNTLTKKIITAHKKNIEYYTKKINNNVSKDKYYLQRAVSYEALGKYIEVTTDCAKAIQLGYINAKVYLIYGDAYFHLGHYQKALQCYRKAAYLDKRNAKEILQRNNVLATCTKYQNKIKLYTQQIRNKDNPGQAFFNRAKIFDKFNQTAKADRDYQQALELEPKNFELLYQYGVFLENVGHLELGEKFKNKAFSSIAK